MITRKSGMTLIEIIVVMGVFGVLMLAGTDFYIQVLRTSSKSSIENEVRQNAESVLSTLSDSVRNAKCVGWTNNPITLNTYGDVMCGTITDSYIFNSGNVTKNGAKIISNSVSVCGVESGCTNTCATNGFTIISPSTSPTTGPIAVSLTVRQSQALSNVSDDFCAKIVLTKTLTPSVVVALAVATYT